MEMVALKVKLEQGHWVGIETGNGEKLLTVLMEGIC